MLGEQDDIAQFARDPQHVAFASKESAQAILGHVGFNRGRVTTVARHRQRGIVEVRSEYLDLGSYVVTARLLKQENPNRIGLFTGGAARHPDTNCVGRALVIEETRDDEVGKLLERVRVAKEGRHRDQQVGEQGLRLRGVFAQDRQIVGHRRRALDLHPAGDAPPNRGLLVIREIMACADAQMGKNAVHCFPITFVQRVRWRGLPIADQLRKPGCDLANRQDEIGKTGGYGAARHGPIFGLVRILDENDALRLLHCLNADRAIRTGAGKDDGEVVTPLRSKRAEEKIDRSPLPARLVERGYRQMMIGDNKLPIGRNDIDMARLQAHPTRDLSHRHFCARRENAGKLALVFRIEMHDDDKRGVDVLGEALEKNLQRPDSSRGCPDAYRWKPLAGLLSACSLGSGWRERNFIIAHPMKIQSRLRAAANLGGRLQRRVSQVDPSQASG